MTGRLQHLVDQLISQPGGAPDRRSPVIIDHVAAAIRPTVVAHRGRAEASASDGMADRYPAMAVDH